MSEDTNTKEKMYSQTNMNLRVTLAGLICGLSGMAGGLLWAPHIIRPNIYEADLNDDGVRDVVVGAANVDHIYIRNTIGKLVPFSEYKANWHAVADTLESRDLTRIGEHYATARDSINAHMSEIEEAARELK